MREPATSCSTCGAALLPAEVLYDRQGDVVCAACFREVSEPARPRAGGRAVAVRTRDERRGAILRWSLLFAVLAASSLQVRHFGLLRLHMICPHVSIDGPAAGAGVPAHLVVRGHVAGSTATRPLWVVARPVGGPGRCPGVVSTPAIADPFGVFAGALDLPGRRGQRYAVSVVSVDQVVDAELQMQPTWPPAEVLARDDQRQGAGGCPCGHKAFHRTLPEGAAVLASVVVVLDHDARLTSQGPFDPDGVLTLGPADTAPDRGR